MKSVPRPGDDAAANQWRDPAFVCGCRAEWERRLRRLQVAAVLRGAALGTLPPLPRPAAPCRVDCVCYVAHEGSAREAMPKLSDILHRGNGPSTNQAHFGRPAEWAEDVQRDCDPAGLTVAERRQDQQARAART